jgi:hypothetical protein
VGELSDGEAGERRLDADDEVARAAAVTDGMEGNERRIGMHASGQRCRSAVGSVCLLSIALFFLAGMAAAQQSQREKMDAFAKCLTSKKATMYGSSLCPHCKDQRKMFGDSFKYIHYVECSPFAMPQDTAACKFAGIRFVPTWIFGNGDRLVGIQSLKQLSDKTGCTLP